MCTVSGHLQFLTVWCPPICGHPRICLYRLKCAKFGQLIPRKITKVVATRCQILGPKCTKFDFGWRLERSADPVTVFKGPTSKGRRKEEVKGMGKVRDREGKREGRER